MNRSIAWILPALLLGAASAGAQQSLYSTPGALGERRLDGQAAVIEARNDARWRLGFLDLEPELAISDVGYVSNIYSSGGDESQSDFRGTGLAGLRGFFNLGPKVVVSPFANLRYTWWQEQENLRSTNESFGMQLFGDFNHLRFNLQAGQIEAQRNLSSELEVPVDTRTNRAEFGLDINFWGPFRFFAGAATAETRYSGSAAEQNVPGLELTTLDVDRDLLSAGFGYEFPNGLKIGLGVERAEARYLDDPGGRSNQGTGPLARSSFEGSHLFFELDAAWRDLEFDSRPGDSRREFKGLAQFEWRFTERLSGGTYGANQLNVSALDSEAIFESRRSGVFVQRRRQDRGNVRIFYEVGRDEFATIVVDDIVRVDDFTTYGLNVRFDLTRRLSIDLGFFDSRRDSTDPDFDRDFSSVQTVIRLGSDLLPW